ncbi:MAG: SSU ribosomal protein S3p (S3e) [Anaerolineae bacterium]|jgi:small subunit ribosomal protein S3|nr:MAG: SSU ribosomal protein S3p (S3e) [Anaerolineae bacterium]
MGRKVHPIGFRLKINKTWEGRWYAEGSEYVDQLHQDFQIRQIVYNEAPRAGVSRVEIERFPGKVKVVVNTAKPGVLIGRKGESVKKMRTELEQLVGKKIDLEIKEIPYPDLDAYLVATTIAEQLERRISYQRAMKRAIQQAMRQGAQGIRVEIGGRLSGAEMARTVNMREGQVPRQTLRADIDFAKTTALTTYGIIGVKVWIYRGEGKLETEEMVEATEGVYVSE